MAGSRSKVADVSVATTVAFSLALCALIVGVAVFGAVVSDDDPAPSTAVVADASTTAAVPSRFDFSATWDDAFVARDPALAPVAPGDVHAITLTATEGELEIAPGVKQVMWSFDNQVPGPVLHGKVGDVFRITLKNAGTLPHSVDFHASKVAWNDEMRSISPGQSLVYEYTATKSGIFMYHCGTAPALHHIGMGMYGAIVIDPPDLAPVDHEYVFVQSDLYGAGEGEVADINKMAAGDWDAVVFNGAVNQYRDRPIAVGVGDRVRAWVIDDGPSENSSFHIVGTIFDTVYKEGAYLLQPTDANGGAQALDLQPAQGGFVEFSLDEEGLYPIVTHKFANVGKGALGLFQAGDGHTDTPTPILDENGRVVTETSAPAASH
jgi:nitrite reductase (NO-forming)